MKIIFENENLKELEKLKEAINEILEINLKELELTEENIKKAKAIKEKSKNITKLYWDFKGINAKIISSEGTELTKIN